jgi:predicted nucleic acid-binding protein
LSVFFDTNILVYAFTVERRQAKAQLLLGNGGVISAQVLNEFTSVARIKHRRSWNDIRAAVEAILSQVEEVISLTAELHAAALRLGERYNLPFCDALIVAAALEGGCDVLLSEDFQHGQVVEGLRIENPFV